MSHVCIYDFYGVKVVYMHTCESFICHMYAYMTFWCESCVYAHLWKFHMWAHMQQKRLRDIFQSDAPDKRLTPI